MLDTLVLLDLAKLPDLDAAVFADAGQVVSHQIHDHDVLCPILFAGKQRFGQTQVTAGQFEAA